MIGTTIQNYQVQSLLGEGGMGKVYLATDTLLGRQVAIKNLNISLTRQPSFLERFKNEAKTLARLSHPNIALLYNYLQKEEDYYMVMEYVEGQNLDELMRTQGALPYQIVIPVVCAALEGLDHAHRKGILHRDIKPANLMLTKEHTVKLMDFGIAKVSDAAKLTQASRVIGTLEFLAPEQIEGKDPSVASDIYAMGVTMYELLTGKLPFTGKSDYMLMQDIVKESPPAPQQFNSNIPKVLSDIVLKSLEKKPEKRFLSAKEFSNALRSAFPGLDEIDEKYLIPAIPATTVISKQGKNPQAPQPTVLGSSIMPPTTVLQNQGQNGPKKPFDARTLLTNKYLYIGLIAVLIVFALFKIVFSGRTTQENNSEDQVSSPPVNSQNEVVAPNAISTEAPAANNDSIAFILNKKNQEDNDPVTEKSVGNNTKSPQAENSQTGKDKEGKAPAPKPAPETIKPTPPLVTEPIRLRASVVLSLRENITPETAQDGQPVSFKVLSPVEVRGATVIPAGAVIQGNIKRIGKMRMDLTFNSVSAKGHSFKLEKSETSASIKEVLSQGNRFKTGLRGTLLP